VKTVIGSNVSTLSQGLTKVLGVFWLFTFEVDGLVDYANPLTASRCSLLQLSVNILNPLGLISPFVVQLKILFQILCVQQVNWDESLRDEFLAR